MDLSQTQLVLIDGLIGTGKSSLARYLARQASLNGHPARWILEHTRPHPTHAYRTLPDFQQPWLNISQTRLIEASLGKWRQFADRLISHPQLTITDGQLFNGDFYRLFWMDTKRADLQAYLRFLVDSIRELKPVVIFLDHPQPGQLLEEIGRRRGVDKVGFEVSWKAMTPYCQNRGLKSVEGWIQMQENFRSICLESLGQIDFPILKLDTGQEDSINSSQQALTWLGINHQQTSPLQERLHRWYDRIYDRVV